MDDFAFRGSDSEDDDDDRGLMQPPPPPPCSQSSTTSSKPPLSQDSVTSSLSSGTAVPLQRPRTKHQRRLLQKQRQQEEHRRVFLQDDTQFSSVIDESSSSTSSSSLGRSPKRRRALFRSVQPSARRQGSSFKTTSSSSTASTSSPSDAHPPAAADATLLQDDFLDLLAHPTLQHTALLQWSRHAERRTLWKSRRVRQALYQFWKQQQQQDDDSTAFYWIQALLFYFIALDCCREDDAQYARTVRLQLLQQGAVASLLRLAVHDPWMQFLQKQGKEEEEKDDDDDSSTSSLPSSQSSFDPTRHGRQRKKKPKALPTVPEKDNDSFAFHSPTRLTRSTLEHVYQTIVDTLPSSHDHDDNEYRRSALSHTCAWQSPAVVGDTELVLRAASRILKGQTEWTDVSCLDAIPAVEIHHDDDDDDDDEDGSSNPIVVTNRLLASTQALPHLAQALAEAHTVAQTTQCPTCRACLRQRIGLLTSLLEGACLLCDENRRLLCQGGYTASVGGYLVVCLIQVLQRQTNDDDDDDDEDGNEIAFMALRSLTNLTHANPLAATELLPHLNVLVSTLQHAAALVDQQASKQDYDTVVFCLNTLTNGCESSSSMALHLRNMAAWLTTWIVNTTDSFRDGLGSKSRRLEKQEEEHLVLAGNGCCLLACLLLQGDDDLRQTIWKGLPGDDRTNKLQFVSYTLRAFCNFYRFSIGDLSVAVVQPIQTLLEQMEKRERDGWE